MMKFLAINNKAENLRIIESFVKISFPDAKLYSCHSAKEGIKLAIAEKPNLVILAAGMSKMDGYQVCQKLKENNSTKYIPIVLTSESKINSESRTKWQDVGADAFYPNLLMQMGLEYKLIY